MSLISCNRWVLITFLAAFIPLQAAIGAPWIPVGDMRAKHSVQQLADRGCLAAPVTTWPLMWADISPTLDDPEASAACRNTMAWRYLTFERNYQRDSDARLSIKAEHASREPLFRDFRNTPREKAGYGINLDVQKGRFAVGVSASYAYHSRDDDEWRLDNSYLAAKAGNWVLGAGNIDRWWGPGWHSSTILSHNARPTPGVWINRASATPSGWAPARWLGPWHFVAFATELESNRYVPNAKLIGARFTFKPAQFVEVGLSRTFQWGGKGRSQSLSTFTDALIGRDNGQQGPGLDPSNQLAGADVRFAAPVGDQVVGVYLQMIGEDEAGGLPAKYMQLAGVDLATSWLNSEQRFYFEVADNLAGSWFSDKVSNVAYEHHVWRNGYRYKGRNMASTWEGDSRAYTVGATQFFGNGSELGLTASYLELNYVDKPPKYDNAALNGGLTHLALFPNSQQVNLYTLSYGFNVWGGNAGRLTLAAQYTDKEIYTKRTTNNGVKPWPKFNGMVTWEYRFD